jgi:hypothetical protein
LPSHTSRRSQISSPELAKVPHSNQNVCIIVLVHRCDEAPALRRERRRADSEERTVSAEARTARLLDAGGLPRRPDLAVTADEYLRRTSRGRWLGLATGLALGIGPLAGSDQLNLVLPRLLAGYLLGQLVSELFTPRRIRMSRRSAALQPRGRRDLIPWWARLAPWAVLAPVICCPLLALAASPRAFSRHSAGYSCQAAVHWPTATELTVVSAMALAGLVIAELALSGLTRRARPADDPAATRLDDLMRGMSAHAVAGGATALGLILLAGLSGAVSSDVQTSYFCLRAPGGAQPAFPEAMPVAPWLSGLAILCFFASLLTWSLSSRRQNPRFADRGGWPS